MTNEEAEEYAKNITYRDAVYNALQGRCIPYRKATLIKLHELLDMIEPLKQEIEQQPCDDCTVIKKLSKKYYVEDAYGYTDEDIVNKVNEIIDVVNELSSVTPSRPKGYWICHRDHCENLGVIPSGLGVYEWCSNCDCGIDIREWQRNHYNFCPNCGADMRESEDKE